MQVVDRGGCRGGMVATRVLRQANAPTMDRWSMIVDQHAGLEYLVCLYQFFPALEFCLSRP